MNLINLSVQQLRQAANLKEQIENLHKQLAAISSSTGVSASVKFVKPAKRKMSAGHIAKIIIAQKLRWSKFRAGKSAAKPTAAPKKKRTISAAGKARIVAAQKARWAKINAAKAKPAVAVKPASVVKTAKKFTMSAAAKAKLSALAKARWAKAKKAGKKKL